MRPAISSSEAGAPAPAALTVLGVRHHSPACAAMVRDAILGLKPATVLIEGPADFNPHMGDLALDHAPPVAIFSFHATSRGSRASYSPFCATSPEWVALLAAREVGASARFCDLPSSHPGFGDRVNRFADPHTARAARAEALLGERLGEDGLDALWDALAEAAPPSELAARLTRYFDLLRPEGADDGAEEARERFMAAHAAFALSEAEGRPVVLVCGGWHAEAIRRYVEEATGEEPVLAPPDAGVRTGSYLVPYDYVRLDRFTGYSAGMPSPSYYEAVGAHGLGVAADWAMGAITHALREAGQVVSTADRIAWAAHARALADARSHAEILRADLLDAALATLVKDGLDHAPAWTQTGALAAGTHPAIAAMLRALAGERRGALAPGTRQPPLVADVETRLAEAGLDPARRLPRIALDWSEPTDRERARLLHALRLLALPGVERLEGPAAAEPRPPRETFRFSPHPDAQGALIEASRWGGTLPMAAEGCLAERVEVAGDDLTRLSTCLTDALFAGLLEPGGTLAERIARGVAASHDVAAVGAAGTQALALYRFGTVFGAGARDGLGRICEAVFARTAWLADTIRNGEEGMRAIPALIAARDMLRDAPDLALERAGYLAIVARLAAGRDGPPALAGAALGTLVACGAGGMEDAVRRLGGFARAGALGDYLAGLFALAREELAHHRSLLQAVAAHVAEWSDEDYLVALPAMRQAFAWFPPRERERLARAVLEAQGLSAAAAAIEATGWMRQRIAPAAQAQAHALEAEAARRLAHAGLMRTERP
ncbi:DUF5682 family protein [Aureimonas psammosilenae]|uniref:DUF5682 family protein n=1 Tax=Aureimonas psammosilenae TaxID=2495496 RepID=UPI0012612F1A|nr:DUF5682 family protein [Aureimonas psammosilenae]